jgi:FkbH-like protein
VFLDDNPLEREWVRSQHPDVAVVDAGASPFQLVRALDRGRYFFALTLSAEDLARSAQYQSEAARKAIEASSSSLEDFLGNLQMEAAAMPVTPANLKRVTQLITTTNQFNVTTRRYTEGQIEQLAESQGAWLSAFRLNDRFGEYGLIGVLICRAGETPQQWEVDSWLMSCRTLGRQMERFMFDRMIEAAQERGIRSIVGVYRPTAKNGLVSRLYDELGFQRLAEDGTEVRYQLDVPTGVVRTADYIRNAALPADESEGAVA